MEMNFAPQRCYKCHSLPGPLSLKLQPLISSALVILASTLATFPETFPDHPKTLCKYYVHLLCCINQFVIICWFLSLLLGGNRLFIYLFGWGRETSMQSIGCLSHTRTGGPGPQPRHVPSNGNQASDPSVHRKALNPLSHTSQVIFKKQY